MQGGHLEPFNFRSSFPGVRLLCFFHFCLQVRIVGSGIRGFLDPSVELNNWFKYVRSTNQSEAQNVRTLLLAGQVGHYYCVVTVVFYQFDCLSLSQVASHFHVTNSSRNSQARIQITYWPLWTIIQIAKAKALPKHTYGGAEREVIAPTHSRPRHWMGWVVSVTPRRALYPVPTVQEAGWTPEPVWTQRLEEKSSLPPPGIEPGLPSRPVRSQTMEVVQEMKYWYYLHWK
jgi:hypothetical protein